VIAADCLSRHVAGQEEGFRAVVALQLPAKQDLTFFHATGVAQQRPHHVYRGVDIRQDLRFLLALLPIEDSTISRFRAIQFPGLTKH
jgi:hypothetical protein